MLCFARLIRWAIVASGTRNAFAISAVVSPPTARSVSASCDGTESEGWQHRNSSVSVSSRAASSSLTGRSRAVVVSSRRRRALSLRHSSTRRRDATVSSHDRGSSGTPCSAHCCVAASSASCTASSQASNCPWRRASAPRTCGASSRSRSSMRGASTVGNSGRPPQAESAARSISAMSIFCIWSIACIARWARPGSGSPNNVCRAVGMICQDRP